VELLLGVLVYTWLIQKMWAKAVNDRQEDRRQARTDPQAAAKVAKYGFTEYLRDAYRTYWGRRGDALTAARAATAAPGRSRVRLRDRLAAAGDTLAGTARRVAETPIVRAFVEPVERRLAKEAPAVPPEPGPVLAVDNGDVPEGSKRYTGTGEEEYRNGRWQPLPAATVTGPRPTEGMRRTAPDGGHIEEFRNGRWQPVPATPDTPDAPPTGTAPTEPPAGDTMTAPTGEVTNFASAIAEIDALISLVQLQHDQASAALRAVILVDNAIDGMQDRQKTIASAVVSLSEHLAALHLDAGSLGPVMDAADVLTAGVVDEMLEYLERLRAIIQKVIASCDAAIAALRAARSSLVAKYADAAATVEENLSGDSRFLAGDNGAAAPDTAPTPASAPEPAPAAGSAAAAT
jgi:hypothetical protein